jgi:molybdate transport system substrate-binding protein
VLAETDGDSDNTAFLHILCGRRVAIVNESRRIVSLALLCAAMVGACASPPGPPVSTPPAGPNSAVNAAQTPTPPQTGGGSTAQPTVLAEAPPEAPDSSTSAITSARDPGVVLVFAASPLADAMQEIASAFMVADRGAAGVRFTLGSSSYLRMQLEHGADADVFASADQTQMNGVRQANRIVGADQVFARDRLVLITTRANPKQIHELKDLTNQGVRWATTDPADPTEQATLAVLDRASADSTYGADFRARAERNILSRLGTPDDAVSRVQQGEADAGIVYGSDVSAQVRPQLQEIELPDALNAITSYTVAAVNGPNSQTGQSFATFLLAPSAQQILSKWGFATAATP